MRKYERAKASKGEFIVSTVFFSIFFVFFAVIYIGLLSGGGDYPSPEDIAYEECTFVRYEIKKMKSGKIYRIEFEGYEELFDIDSVVSKHVNKTVLGGLRAGDGVTVSIDEDGNLCAMAHGESYILSYEDYLSAHESNHRNGMIIAPILLCLYAALVIGNCVLWKKTGECFKIKRS